jgi:hypothetical protein
MNWKIINVMLMLVIILICSFIVGAIIVSQEPWIERKTMSGTLERVEIVNMSFEPRAVIIAYFPNDYIVLDSENANGDIEDDFDEINKYIGKEVNLNYKTNRGISEHTRKRVYWKVLYSIHEI